MKTIFLTLIIFIFNISLFSYEYNFEDSIGQKGLFQNNLPYSKKTDNCITNITLNENYILKKNKEFFYEENSTLILNNCNSKIEIIKEFKDEVKSKIVFKNKMYLNINNAVWLSDGTKSGTILLKKDLDTFRFNTTNYNLYILSYPGMNGLKIYTIDEKNKTLKRILKGVSISSSRFAHFGTPHLYITRLGNFYKMDEITFDIKVINSQPLVYYPSFLTPLGEKLLHFVSEKGEIFITNGTKDGTKRIKSFRDTRKDIYFKIYAVENDKILFLTQDIKNNKKLYETDGTIEGTTFIKEMNN